VITVIAGSRTIPESIAMFTELEYAIVESGFEITEVVGGKARGADRLGEEWAKLYGVPFKPFFPQYRDLNGEPNPAAPFERNEAMAVYAATNCLDGGALIALVYADEPDTTGTADMCKRAKKHGLRVHIRLIPPPPRDDEEL
jgi:hypothetical protein